METHKTKEISTKFNFSKPLCLIFALMLLFTMFMPWFRFSAKYETGGLTVLNMNIEAAIFSLQQRFSETVDLLHNYGGLAGVSMNEYDEIIWMVNGILLLITAVFLLIAFSILLFGLIGTFSGGKARYFFARLGGTLLIIMTFSVLIIGIFGGQYLRDMMSMVDKSYGIDVSFGITFWPAITLVSAIAFRIWGIKLLRKLNYRSSIARGRMEIAEREYAMLHGTKFSEQ